MAVTIPVTPIPCASGFKTGTPSLRFKLVIRWHDHNKSSVPLAHPNAKTLASALHTFWVKRFRQQFPEHDRGPGRRMRRIFGRNPSNGSEELSPYEEPEDDVVFEGVLTAVELPLASVGLKEVEDDLFRMTEEIQRVNWSA